MVFHSEMEPDIKQNSWEAAIAQRLSCLGSGALESSVKFCGLVLGQSPSDFMLHPPVGHVSQALMSSSFLLGLSP